jgi:hypothetical protein
VEGFTICLVVLVGLVWAIVKLATMGGPTRLLQTGLIARGILLRVDIPLTRWSAEGGRQLFQRRQLRIDVELPGRAPYEVDQLVQFPTNLSKLILPGATVELRVDPKNPKKLVVSGPGVALGASFFNPALQAPNKPVSR